MWTCLLAPPRPISGKLAAGSHTSRTRKNFLCKNTRENFVIGHFPKTNVELAGVILLCRLHCDEECSKKDCLSHSSWSLSIHKTCWEYWVDLLQNLHMLTGSAWQGQTATNTLPPIIFAAAVLRSKHLKLKIKLKRKSDRTVFNLLPCSVFMVLWCPIIFFRFSSYPNCSKYGTVALPALKIAKNHEKSRIHHLKLGGDCSGCIKCCALKVWLPYQHVEESQ